MNCRIITGLLAFVAFFVLGSSCTISGGNNSYTTPPIYAEDSPQSALDKYINNDDPSFSWDVASNSTNAEGVGYVVDMTSQTWHNIEWKHKMYIFEPAKLINPEYCALYIAGGSNGNGPIAADMQSARLIASLTGMYVAVLWQVPNQPLLGSYSEDALIGETFLKAIETGDMSWPLLLPMAKSAVRAMDTVQELIRKNRGHNIKGFVVFGMSKRGWTTWMAAATKDNRIVAIAPMVINLLNMQAQFEYMYANWGYYSSGIGEYSHRNFLPNQIDPNASEEEMKLREYLWHLIDPYFYLDRITMPKFLIHGTNDVYWNLDATKFYWNDLVGEKYILTLPNAGHSLGSEREKAFTSIAAYAKFVVEGGTLQSMKWKYENNVTEYTLSVTSGLSVIRAKLWVAYNGKRDFLYAKWNSTDLQVLPEKEGNFSVTVKKPESGYVAFYIEIETEYECIPYSLTTEVFNP